MSWHDQAACAGATDVFFSDRSIPQAKAICAGCPVREECLAENLGEKFGVFGGTTPRERARLRRGTRPRGSTSPHAPEQRAEAERLIAAGWQDRHVARRTGVPQRTILDWRRSMGIKLGAGGKRDVA